MRSSRSDPDSPSTLNFRGGALSHPYWQRGHGWLDVDLELGKRWVGGTLRLIPWKEGTAPKDVPLEAFFKKIIGIRDRLRVLEQKLNSHPTLTAEEKLELQGYISRCYGSLTTFNVLLEVLSRSG